VDESAVYTTSEMNELESYQIVTIIHAEEVTIDPDSPGVLGAGAGAASVGYAGSALGGESAGLALAVMGGIAGYLIEQELTDTAATRYLIDVDGRQRVIVQKDTADPLKPGDTAMMIGDYKPRLVKAPQDIIDSLQESKESSRVRVNEKTGEYLFDDELAPFQSQTESETEHSSEQHHESGTWIEPQANDLIDRARQQ
jgi:outer membrane lipoprotein SlyB